MYSAMRRCVLKIQITAAAFCYQMIFSNIHNAAKNTDRPCASAFIRQGNAIYYGDSRVFHSPRMWWRYCRMPRRAGGDTKVWPGYITKVKSLREGLYYF